MVMVVGGCNSDFNLFRIASRTGVSNIFQVSRVSMRLHTILGSCGLGGPGVKKLPPEPWGQYRYELLGLPIPIASHGALFAGASPTASSTGPLLGRLGLPGNMGCFLEGSHFAALLLGEVAFPSAGIYHGKVIEREGHGHFQPTLQRSREERQGGA